MSNEDTELYDEVMQAYEEATAESSAVEGTAEVVEESVEEAAGEEQPKEEQAAKEESAEESAAVPEAEAAVEEPPSAWSQDKPPQSWSTEAREKWKELPEEIRREVVRREEASVQGIRQLHEKIAPAEGFLKGMEPYLAEAKAQGVVPEQYIGNVMQSERILRTAEMPAKFNEIVRIAESYGIPLRNIINQSVGKEMVPPPQEAQPQALPPEVQQELQEMRQWREQMSTTAVSNEVNAFGQDRPYFQEVRGIMADLIESGTAKDLSDAYEKAQWLEPNVRAKLVGQQQEAQNQQLRQSAGQASIPDSGTIDVPVGGEEPEDVNEIVRQAFYKQSSGRM
jgi:hypothetical protein